MTLLKFSRSHWSKLGQIRVCAVRGNKFSLISLKYFCNNMYDLQSENTIYIVYAINCVRNKVKI